MTTVGVILDSGGVLIRPANGRWFLPLAFDQVLAQHGLSCEDQRMQKAVALGEEYLREVHSIPLADETAERPVWVRCYEIILEAAGLPGALAEAITTRWERDLSVELYPWTRPVLSELRRRQIPVVVLSDAWPSLRRWYRELALDAYVVGMVISGEEGVGKPDPRVFAKARGLLGGVDRPIFVDDWPGHVRAALSLGLRAFRLRTEGARPEPGLEEFADLRELLDHLSPPAGRP